jgi:hypothetical protein
MTVYGLDFINKLNQTKQEITSSTKNCLVNLEALVGSPHYIRTPKFENYENKKWETFRHFKKTQIKSENLDDLETLKMDIRELLNKLTSKTYSAINEQIHEKMNNLSETQLQFISPIIFDISSSNLFFSKEYAMLFESLINKYPMILSLFKSKLSEYLGVFKNIEWVSSVEDYDKYCEINKINSKRKALSGFFSNLMLMGIIPAINILRIVLILQQKINVCISEGTTPIIEEIVENICIIMNIIYKKLDKENDQVKIIIDNIKQIIDTNNNVINNKITFKYMDILDNLNIEY